MPFVSEAQRRAIHAKDPAMAKRWEAETPKGPLPEHVEPKHRPKPLRKHRKHRRTNRA